MHVWRLYVCSRVAECVSNIQHCLPNIVTPFVHKDFCSCQNITQSLTQYNTHIIISTCVFWYLYNRVVQRFLFHLLHHTLVSPGEVWNCMVGLTVFIRCLLERPIAQKTKYIIMRTHLVSKHVSFLCYPSH